MVSDNYKFLGYPADFLVSNPVWVEKSKKDCDQFIKVITRGRNYPVFEKLRMSPNILHHFKPSQKSLCTETLSLHADIVDFEHARRSEKLLVLFRPNNVRKVSMLTTLHRIK